MPLEQDINQLLKEAMYAKDQATANVLRMIKTKIMERRTAPGFKGQVDDALIIDVVASYQKSLRNALKEYESTGERGAEMRSQLEFEIAYCDRFLPKKLDEKATTELIAKTVEELKVTDPKQAGRVLGHLMKSHKAVLDAEVAKRLIAETLKN